MKLFRFIDLPLLYSRRCLSKRKSVNDRLMLSYKYDERVHDPTGWWISEKLDGIRGFWDGSLFHAKSGSVINAPQWFTKDLPKDMHLDGELYCGRNNFHSTRGILRSPEHEQWEKTRYHVFDCPHIRTEPFEKRMQILKEYFENFAPWHAEFVEQTVCKSKEHLNEEFHRVLNLGGEGLMIRQMNSVYKPGRSKTLLKVKKAYSAKAVVVGHNTGTIKGQDVCISLKMRLTSGIEFSVGVGLTNRDRKEPPKIGSVVEYNFMSLSHRGVPCHASFIGVCMDETEGNDERREFDDDGETEASDETTRVVYVGETEASDETTRVVYVDETEASDETIRVANVYETEARDETTRVVYVDETEASDETTGVANVYETEASDETTHVANIVETEASDETTDAANVDETEASDGTIRVANVYEKEDSDGTTHVVYVDETEASDETTDAANVDETEARDNKNREAGDLEETEASVESKEVVDVEETEASDESREASDENRNMSGTNETEM